MVPEDLEVIPERFECFQHHTANEREAIDNVCLSGARVATNQPLLPRVGPLVG